MTRILESMNYRLVAKMVAAVGSVWVLQAGCGPGDVQQAENSSAIVNGPVSFGSEVDISGGYVNGASALDAQDLDGDGLADVVVFEGGKHGNGVTFAWFRSPANPRTGNWARRDFPKPSRMNGSSPNQFIGAAKLGDVDGDGDYDVVLTIDNHSGATKNASIYWIENPRPQQAATTSWTLHQVRNGMAFHHINDIELADMDADGKLDIIVRSLDPNNIHIYFQNSATSWTQKLLSTPFSTGEGMAIGLLDGGNKPDIALNGYWLRAPSSPRSQSYTQRTIDSAYGTHNANTKEAIGDIDGDGLLDVIISPAEGYRNGGNWALAWYKNPGNPQNVSSWARRVLPTGSGNFAYNGGHTVALADLDGDGDLDVVSGVAWSMWGQQRSTRIFYNLDGNGSYGNVQVLSSSKGLYTGVVRDLGGDGDLDIVGQETYSGGSRPWFYESNVGSGPPPTNPFAQAIAIPSTFQAENFHPSFNHDTDTGNAGNAYRSDTDVDVYSAGGSNYKIGRIRNGEHVSWLLASGSQSGNRTVTLHVSNIASGGSMALAVDHTIVTPYVSVPNTGNWNTFTPIVFRDVPIGSGEHYLTVHMRTTGSATNVGDIDRIQVSAPNATQNPFARSISIPSTIEAEDFHPNNNSDSDSGNAGNVYRSDTDVDVYGVSGNNYKIGRVYGGEYVSYLLDTGSQGGTWNIALRVSNTTSGGAIALAVDQGTPTSAITVPNTGAWNTFTTITFNGVAIGNDAHYLTLYFQRSNGFVGDVDRITISAAGASGTSCNDGVKNQGEAGIDCGGPCAACGAFQAAIAIPSTFEGEDFYPAAYGDSDTGNQSGLYRNDTDVDVYKVSGSNYKVGRIKNGEYFSYLVDTGSRGGAWNITLRVSNVASGGSVALGVDGSVVTSAKAIPKTGNWNTFTTVTFTNVSIGTGAHLLGVYSQTAGSNGFVGDVDRVTIQPY